jgi:non-specific serine/threonine protein kinase
MFGGLRLVRADLPAPMTRFALQKAGALLGYLALTLRPQPRERLIDIFWPEMEPTAARDNLSTTLGLLRRQLEPTGVARGAVLVANHAQIELNPAAVTTDVADFERLLEQATAEGTVAVRADLLQRAVDLYDGDLLPGVYYDWSLSEMVRLQSRCAEALKRLREDREALGEPVAALEAARRLVSVDAYSEEAHLHLIRLQVSTGHVKDAADGYRRVSTLFEEEYGAPLSAATRRAIEDLLAAPPLRIAESSAIQARSEVDDLEAATATTDAEPFPEATPLAPATVRGVRAESPPLPALLSLFFGRETELEQVAGLLLARKGIPDGPDLPPQPSRLVTMIGLGGNGKTRLAIEFLRQASGRLGFWCAFVPLADLTSPEQIPERIAATLRIKLTSDGERSPLDQVVAFLAALDSATAPCAILCLDNLEHLLPVESGPEIPEAGETLRVVQTLLERVPGLAILCTSRQRLGLRGERLVPIGPLPVPEEGVGPWAVGVRELAPGNHLQTASDTQDSLGSGPEDQRLTPNALLAFPSIRLYLDRAQAARPDFSLTPTNSASVAALCRHLDGSPLAIELAAAWVRMLPPRKMWERLTQGLQIPEGGYSDLPARHRSLEAALDWSYRLLSPEAQRFLARLSVFVGGWTLESATTVAGDCDEFHVLQLLARLQETSLIGVETSLPGAVDEDEGAGRYHFLKTVRAYTGRRLEEQGEAEAFRRRHALYFLEFASAADLELRGPRQAEWLARLDTDHDNLRAALTFFLTSGLREDAEAAQRLTCAMLKFWQIRGHIHEGRRWLQEVLTRTAEVVGSSALHARVLNGAGAFALEQGDYTQARELYEAALAMRRTVGDRTRVGDSLHNLGHLALVQLDYVRAQACYEESLQIAREQGDTLRVADGLHHLGWLAHEQGQIDQAVTLYEESLTVRRPLGDLRGIAFTLHNLANVCFDRQDLVRSRVLQEECLAIRRDLGDRKGLAGSYSHLARVALALHDFPMTRHWLVEAIRIFEEIGEGRELFAALHSQADLAVELGQFTRAAQLYGGVEGLRVASGMRRPGDGMIPTPWIARAREALGAEAFESHEAAGRTMTLAEVVAFALQDDAHIL